MIKNRNNIPRKIRGGKISSAYHEAGHVVAARALELKVQEGSIGPDEEPHAWIIGAPGRDWESEDVLKRRIAMLHAGGIAVDIYMDDGEEWSIGGGDRHEVEKLARKAMPYENEI